MADVARGFGREHAGLRWAGYLLGFGIGGFFDGIVLHQILEWHHLLSGIEAAKGDIRLLIMTDGFFHLLMYEIAGMGLFLLWRERRRFAEAGADRRLLAAVLIGFGAWHVVDGVLSHWVLGIHRIRMASANPLFWDLLWFIVFGLAPLLIGWRTGRAGLRTPGTPTALVFLVLSMGALAALPAPKDDTVMVLFWPGTTPQQAVDALGAVDGRLLWMDASGTVMAAKLPDDAPRSALYDKGAMLVGNGLLPAGCIDWIRS